MGCLNSVSAKISATLVLIAIYLVGVLSYLEITRCDDGVGVDKAQNVIFREQVRLLE